PAPGPAPAPPPPPGPPAGRGPRCPPPAPARRSPRPQDAPAPPLTAEQRLLVLDAWRRSGLPAGDFAPLVGISKHTLYAWKRKFDSQGPAGLVGGPRGGPARSRPPEATRRAILLVKEANPDWGCEGLPALLLRGPGLPASPQAIARVLREAGYELEEGPTRPHPDRPRSFERARANQLWRECGLAAVFVDLGDARRRIGLFIDHYNFQRPHQGIGGLVP